MSGGFVSRVDADLLSCHAVHMEESSERMLSKFLGELRRDENQRTNFFDANFQC